jgi:hypothetical protein
MAETSKQTESKLKAQIAALLNQAAKETDVKEKQKLTAQAKALKVKVDSLKKQSESNKNLSVVQKAQKELARLQALDPNTPGVAPLIAAQEKIIAAATAKGLPAKEETPSVIAAPKPKPKITTSSESKANQNIADATKGSTKPQIVPEGFNVGSFRMADEASMAAATGIKPVVDVAKSDIQSIYDLARSQYANVDSIFLFDDELKALLTEAVGDPATAKDDMDPKEFARRLAASDWSVRNADTYAKRDAQRREYNGLMSKYEEQLTLADTQDKKDAINKKIGELKTNSAYARGLAAAKAYIEATAGDLIGTLTPDQLESFTKRIYDSGNDKDANIITKELSYLINYKPGTALGGAAGDKLQALRKTAAANGFDLDKDFGSSINTWLQRLAVGESVTTFENVIRAQAKLGLPDKVAGLLDQGVNLDAIYSPYKKLMASTLEVNPETIQLNDSTLRSAIGPDKEMSLYDFQRQLRKDARWQYTNNAREEVSNSALKVLQDFGFQG